MLLQSPPTHRTERTLHADWWELALRKQAEAIQLRSARPTTTKHRVKKARPTLTQLLRQRVALGCEGNSTTAAVTWNKLFIQRPIKFVTNFTQGLGLLCLRISATNDAQVDGDTAASWVATTWWQLQEACATTASGDNSAWPILAWARNAFTSLLAANRIAHTPKRLHRPCQGKAAAATIQAPCRLRQHLLRIHALAECTASEARDAGRRFPLLR